MDTSVLFIVFNRPDTTKQVFEAIRQAKPTRLYIAADGPRKNHIREKEKCEEVRKIVTAVDWGCEVKTLFRNENLGCKQGVSTAINWFFEHEKEGVILEDDCLPCKDFFPYCAEMLQRYKNESDVFMISGYNPLGATIKSDKYFYSRNPSVWGWATWKDRWDLYDIEMKQWYRGSAILDFLPYNVRLYFSDMFTNTKNGKINTWDYQLTYTIFQNNKIVIKPIANLITNIGVSGTNAYRKDKNHFIPYGALVTPLKFDTAENQDELFYYREFKIYILKRPFKLLKWLFT